MLLLQYMIIYYHLNGAFVSSLNFQDFFFQFVADHYETNPYVNILHEYASKVLNIIN